MKIRTLRHISLRLLKDESGAIMIEYVIMLVYLIVATIWINKTTDTLIFGISPYVRNGDPNATENLTGAYDYYAQFPNGDPTGALGMGDLQTQLTNVGGGTQSATASNPEKSYLGQLCIFLSRP